MAQSLEEQLQQLLEKVDRILSLIESQQAEPRRRSSGVNAKSKAPPLGEDEIAIHQKHFEKLYQTGDSGEELQAENILDQMPVEELRRFADANNLNVTSKTPKQKLMKLIAGRFRERRQLMKPHFTRRSPMD